VGAEGLETLDVAKVLVTAGQGSASKRQGAYDPHAQWQLPFSPNSLEQVQTAVRRPVPPFGEPLPPLGIERVMCATVGVPQQKEYAQSSRESARPVRLVGTRAPGHDVVLRGPGRFVASRITGFVSIPGTAARCGLGG
jgi:hypothetical protein